MGKYLETVKEFIDLVDGGLRSCVEPDESRNYERDIRLLIGHVMKPFRKDDLRQARFNLAVLAKTMTKLYHFKDDSGFDYQNLVRKYIPVFEKLEDRLDGN